MAQSLYTRALDHFISFLAVKDRILSMFLVKPCKEAEKGIYTIKEIKQSYYVAENKGMKVLVQSDLDLNGSLTPLFTTDLKHSA